MIEKDKSYFINYPIFLKYKTRFNLLKMTRIKQLKKVFINERIAELPFVFRNLPSKLDSKILDLGCSESSLSLHMASIGYKVFGVDMRDFPYKHPNFNFVKSDIMNLSFPDSSFDAVCCISTLEHVGLGFYSDNPLDEKPDKKAMGQIIRVLKKGGTLILSVPFGVYKKTKQQRIYDLERLKALLENFIIEEKIFLADFTHPVNNYWKEVSLQDAEKIESAQGRTNCLCMVKAKKADFLQQL
ncbi:MAG: class I SAM-dependent methyltransferase [Candidatus Omnitrophica bacterium]|nr:class I SAM-dependent methyltransferase [Candidatus Omnitrophota bacterium]